MSPTARYILAPTTQATQAHQSSPLLVNQQLQYENYRNKSWELLELNFVSLIFHKQSSLKTVKRKLAEITVIVPVT